MNFVMLQQGSIRIPPGLKLKRVWGKLIRHDKSKVLLNRLFDDGFRSNGTEGKGTSHFMCTIYCW